MKKDACSVIKKACPCWDMSGDGTEWCDGDRIGEWELCPIPKKRDNKIRKEAEYLGRLEKFREEIKACIPRKCWTCKYRLVDGAPEPIPICTHPSLKTRESQYIIDYQKNPPKTPSKCPLKQKTKRRVK